MSVNSSIGLAASAFSVSKKELIKKGYDHLLCFSKSRVKPKEVEFKDALEIIYQRIGLKNLKNSNLLLKF